MSFLSGVFLWGLPLALAPVIIHLLHRRRRDVIRWGAMRFLLEATTRRRRIWRLEDLLLMLLRAAVVAALVLALAQPLLRSSWFGAAAARDVIVVLDTSMSTSRQDGDVSLFDRQLDKVERLVDDLKESDVLRVLMASTAAEWLAPVGIPMNAGAKGEVRSKLQDLEPTLASADMMNALQKGIEAEPANKRATRVITFVTDGQSHGWRPAAVEGWQALREKLTGMPQRTVVNMLSAGDPDRAADNLSLESVTASRAVVGPNERVTLTASVKNTGDIPAGSTLAAWDTDTDSIGVTAVAALEPGETANVRIEYVFGKPGVHQVTCQLNRSDDLVMDNAGHYIVEVIDQAPVLVVDGAPLADPLYTETGYLVASLGSDSSETAREWKSVFQPHLVDVAALESEPLSQYRCVVLANVPPLSEKTVENLVAYVQSGGGLWIVLGDQTDPVSFNKTVFANGGGLSPLPLDKVVGDEDNRDQYASVHPPSPHHSATRLLADTQRLDIHRAQVYRRHRFLQEEGSEAVSVLLATSNGEPLAVENAVGRGRVIVQGIPLGVTWSNLPICQAFVVMIHEWLWYLTEPTATQWNLNVGETLAVSLPSEGFESEATVTTPRDNTINVTGSLREDQYAFSYSGTLWPGGYTLALQDKTGKKHAFPFYVSRDVDESNLTPLSQPETEMLTAAAGISFVEDPLAKTKTADSAPASQPLWPWLLMLLLAAMVIELILAGRVTRRRQTQSPGMAIDMKTP